MAEIVLIDPFISIGGNDLSEHFKSISLGPTVDTQDSTAFGDEWTEMEAGLKEFSVTLDFNQDFAAGAFDDVMWPMFGTKQPLVARPTMAALGPANPERRGMVIVSGYPIMDGSVGEILTGSLTLAGSGPLTRHTS